MNKKMLIGFSVMILLARFIYALGTPSFIDTADADFSAGTLHLTNISGSGANANVTLNSTIINTFRAYNLSGNFTSQIFDTNSTNSIFDKIEWSRVLANSSDVLGYAMDTGAGDIGAFYRNGSIGADTAQADLNSNVAFTSNLAAYTIPAGFSRDDIVGFAWDDDASATPFVFFRNGSVVNDIAQTALTTDLAFTGISAYSIPSGFNASNIIGFVVDSDNTNAAVFFRNLSYVSAGAEQPPFTFSDYHAFTLPSGFSADDIIGIEYDRGANDIAAFFKNGSIVSDITQTDFTTDIAFNTVFAATYPSEFSLIANTNITLQTRVSNDSITFTSWSNNYTNPNGGESIADNVARYVQYKAVLETPNKYISPSLLNITINFTGDVTSPSINKIRFSPNSTDDVDPNVLLNFTVNVTDNPHQIEVKTVVLQYKQSGAGTFTNATMEFNSATNLYNASFIPNVADTWNYRVYASDNASNNISSDTQNISVQNDKTWRILPSAFNNLGCIFSAKCTAGNLTINNTGEFTLNFDLSSNYGDTSFNDTEPFDLSAGEYKAIKINLTAGTTASESNVIITIDSTTSNADPDSTTTNFTFTTSAGGPLFDINIISPPTEINRSYPGEFYLNVSLKNIGNESAGFTWINWTLPANWLNISKTNLTINFSSIAVQEIVFHNITVNLTSSASTGTQRVNVTAASNDSASDSATASIVVTETSTTTTAAASSDSGGSGGGSSGGSGGSSGGGSMVQVLVKPEVIEISKIVDLVRGKENSFKIDVKNTFEGSVLENLKLGVEGFPEQYLSIEPKLIPRLYFGEETSFTVSLSAPSYKESEEHLLKAIVTGMVVKTTQLEGAIATSQNPFILKNFISLLIHEVGREEVDVALKEAETLIEEMRMSSFPVHKAAKLLEDAKQAIQERKYDLTKEISFQIKIMRDNAILANSRIENLKQRVIGAESKGLHAEETKKLINLARAAFEREDFATALKRANDAELSLILETGGKINPINFMVEYWWPIFAGLVALLGIMHLTKKKLILILITRKVDDLEKEQEAINGLVMETQKDYFDNKKISSAEYHRAMYNYEKRSSEISQEISRLRSKRGKIIEISNEIRNMEKERQNVKSLVKELQESYYNKKSVPRSVYMKREKEYQTREIEIEKSIAVLETKLAKREKMHSMMEQESRGKGGKKINNQEIQPRGKKENGYMLKIRIIFKRIFGKGHEENKNLLVINNQRSIAPLNEKRLEHIKNGIIGAQNENNAEHHKKIREDLLQNLSIAKTGEKAHEEMESPALINEKPDANANKSAGKKIINPNMKNEEIIAAIKSRFGLEKIKSEKAFAQDYQENKNRAYSKDLSKDIGMLEKHGFMVTPIAISKTVAHKDNILRHLKEVHKHG